MRLNTVFIIFSINYKVKAFIILKIIDKIFIFLNISKLYKSSKIAIGPDKISNIIMNF